MTPFMLHAAEYAAANSEFLTAREAFAQAVRLTDHDQSREAELKLAVATLAYQEATAVRDAAKARLDRTVA